MKSFIKKKWKLLIILLVIIIIIIGTIVFLFTREESSKIVPRDPYELSLVNIDDLEYDFINTYYSEFTLENSGYNYQVETSLNIYENGSCQYYSAWDSDAGYFIFETTDCNYSIDKNENIQITMNGILQLYNNYLGDYQTEQISNYTLNGIFKYNNKSHLLLNGITFENLNYYKYTTTNTYEVLVDANNNTYRSDGTQPWEENSEQLDLSLYTIVDRREIDNNTSSYTNYYDITDIASNNLINIQNYYFVDYIDMYDYRNLYNSDEVNVVILGTKRCTYCVDLVEDMRSLQIAHFFHAKYLDVSTLSGDDYNDIIDFIINVNIEVGFPITIVVKNGEIIDYMRGYGSIDYLQEFLRENEIIK